MTINLQPKMHQISLGSTRTRWGAYSATPDPLCWIKGNLLLRKERGIQGGEERKREGSRRKGNRISSK